MVHLTILTRGIKYARDQFLDTLAGNMLPYPTNNGMRAVQLAVHPIEFYDLIFPKQSLANVLKGLKWTGSVRKDLAVQTAALRKLMGLKKIPKLDYKDVQPIHIGNALDVFSAYPVGIRHDKGVWPKGHELDAAEQL